MKKIYPVLLFSLLAHLTFAQDFKCGTQQRMNEVYKTNPDALKMHEALIRNSAHTVISKEDTQMVVTIPIVFHIIHQYGSENISDAQVMDQVDVLNRDYRKMNADTADVVPEFKPLIADIHIEFKLAAIDPDGNCTNGIEHIYSHETNVGDDNSKLQQWPPNMYLNVWVVRSMENGVAGYAYYPSAVDGSSFARFDGVIILDGHIGTIGTGSIGNSRSLTHEIGHYLNLPHCWGNTNDPGVACGDDGFEDTPVTMGFNLFCPIVNYQENAAICNDTIVENFQNYMEYSYCSNMFTLDQSAMMNSVIHGPVGNRMNLIDSANAVATGINLLTVPLCAPVADFKASTHYTCMGQPVNFTDVSWNGVVDSRMWTFQDGDITTSTSATPTVTFNSQGYKKVTLRVTNAAGSDSLSITQYIYVSPDYPDFLGPRSMNLNDDYRYWFIVDNPENNYNKFDFDYSHGYDNSICFKLNNYKNTAGAPLHSDDYFYNRRLGETIDNLITPSFDLTTTSNIEVSFKYAYATNATSLSNITESLKIYASKDCGKTWSLRKTISGSDLITAGFAGSSDFAPANNSQWKTATFNYTANSSDSKTRFRFEFFGSDYANNLYIDDININGTLGLEENVFNAMDIKVFPNPASSNGEIFVSFIPGNNNVELILRDMQGNTVSSKTVSAGNAQVTESVANSGLAAACYMLEIRSGNASTIKKVIVL